MTGIHVPACADLREHIDKARLEAGSMSLSEFVDDVTHTWDTERRIADAGDEAVVRYWQAVEADWMRAMGVSL